MDRRLFTRPEKPEYAVRRHPFTTPYLLRFKTIFPNKKPSERGLHEVKKAGKKAEKGRKQAIISGKKCDFTQKQA